MNITEEVVTYTGIDGITMKGFVAFNALANGKLPIVMVIHEWWGLNEYAKSRTRQLAELGYFAMAVDIYGDGKTADNPTDAAALSDPFDKDVELMKNHFDAAVLKAKSFERTDASKVAVIGYCFGGGMALNLVRMGADLKGVVSFHGSLKGVPANRLTLKADILVCHGDADEFVKEAEVKAFIEEMNAAGASFMFRSYAGAMHAFTNPKATAMGQKFDLPIAYNADADKASWDEMKLFLKEIFR